MTSHGHHRVLPSDLEALRLMHPQLTTFVALPSGQPAPTQTGENFEVPG